MLETLTEFLSTYGYAAIFVCIFVESTGLPAPGESLLIAAGVMAGHGALDVHGVVLAAFLGGMLGDNLGYWIGHRFGRGFVLRFGPRLGISARTYAAVERRFVTVGPPLVLVARFVVVLRQTSGFASGTLRFPWWRFLFFNALGSALWSSAYGYGAFLLGDRLQDWFGGHPWFYATAALALLAGAAVALLIRRRRRRARTEPEPEPPVSPSA